MKQTNCVTFFGQRTIFSKSINRRGCAYRHRNSNFRDLDWKVYAFEPDPNNLKYFLEKFKGDESVILEQKLVLEKESQKVQFYVSKKVGISSTVNFHHTISQ